MSICYVLKYRESNTLPVILVTILLLFYLLYYYFDVRYNTPLVYVLKDLKRSVCSARITQNKSAYTA